MCEAVKNNRGEVCLHNTPNHPRYGYCRKQATYSIFLKTYDQSGLKGYELLTQHSDNLKLFLIGNVVAFLVAILAIKFFIGIIKKYGFKPWGYYRIIAVIALLLYFTFGK